VATPSESIRLSVGGVINEHWTAWSVDSDLLIPADAFELELFTRSASTLPPEVAEGSPCQLLLGDDVVLTGRLDDIDHTVARQRNHVQINGRDLAGFLVDCSTPFVSMQDVSLQQIIDEVVKPFGISRVRLQTDNTASRRRVQIQPGQNAWEALQQVAEASGAWPWIEPDGTLVVGGPDYNAPTAGRLQLRFNGHANNVDQLRVHRGISRRYSEVTVLGQHGAFDTDDFESDRVALKSKIKDAILSARGIFRPRVVVDSSCDSTSLAEARAKKLLADSQMEGFEMRATVRGWRASGGAVWTPGQRVEVVSEPHGIDGVYFLMGRALRHSRRQGRISELRLREDKTWILGEGQQRKTRQRKTIDDGDSYL
jgi:prophage tail gpP-like protein